MATEQGTPSETTAAPRGPSRGLVTALVIAVVLLSAAVVFLFVSNQELREINKDYATTKDELEAEIRDLDEQIAEMEKTMQRQDVDLEEKNRRVGELERDLNSARQTIERMRQAGKLQGTQLEEYKTKVDQLNYYLQKYQQQIATLRAENDSLRTVTSSQAGQINKLDSSLSLTERERELYRTQVEVASVLKAVEFRFAAVDRRGKEAETGTELRERRIENLKVTFRLLENEVAQPGARTVFVLIKGPDGAPYRSNDGTAGTFTINGNTLPYTARSSVEYDRKSIPVTVTYPTPAEKGFTKGNHTVTVYCDGYQIGNASFVVR